MLRLLGILGGMVLILPVLGPLALAAEKPGARDPSGRDRPAEVGLRWHTSYGQAFEEAKREGKMLLICFYQPGEGQTSEQFAREALSDPCVAERLEGFVRARLPVDTRIWVAEGQIALMEHAAFAEMLGLPGMAILDFAHPEAAYYGHVVSTFPLSEGRPYTARQLAVILDLPPGTRTQRTLIYAVRIHPDGPASTKGSFDPYLAEEARQHSEHQARIRRQGHHNWERRFHRINAELPKGLLACEVCAESWPGENLLEAAIECVRCWRLSSGHWEAVRTEHRVYGYDMKRGSNGVWYATGIFGRG
jgi:hypothetical protein